MRWISAAFALATCAAWPGAARAADRNIIGFYAPWDAASLASLQRHAPELRAVVPAWISVTGADHKVTIAPDLAGRAALAALSKPPRLWLMVQNALMGTWDGANAAALLRDPRAAGIVLDQIEDEAKGDKAAGLVIDLEDLPADAQADLPGFLALVRERCRRHGWSLAVTAPVSNLDWNLPRLAAASDRVILMAYDEHWQSGTAGPIASNAWFAAALRLGTSQVGSAKAVVAIASYAYDWPAGRPATILSIPQAEALAHEQGVQLKQDEAGEGQHFSYSLAGITHEVWMSGAPAVAEQIAIARVAGVRGVAVWRLGTEDPEIWRHGDAAAGQ